MLVKFWGTRGSIPTPGRMTEKYGGNTSCVEVRTSDKIIVFDCGTGLRELGLSCLKEFRSDGFEAHLFVSHTHWDHIQGFPFFTPAFQPGNTFYLYGTANRPEPISQLLSGQMQPEYFPTRLDDMSANFHYKSFKEKVDIGNKVSVNIAELYHPGNSYGFALCHEDKKIVYATDNELNLGLKLIKENDFNSGWLDPLFTLRKEIIPFFQDADLVIADCQYTDLEYPNKVGWGHASISAVMEVMLVARVKRLALFHHDPMHTDKMVDDIIEEAKRYALVRNRTLDIFGAREGLVLKV